MKFPIWKLCIEYFFIPRNSYIGIVTIATYRNIFLKSLFFKFFFKFYRFSTSFLQLSLFLIIFMLLPLRRSINFWRILLTVAHTDFHGKELLLLLSINRLHWYPKMVWNSMEYADTVSLLSTAYNFAVQILTFTHS